MGSTRLTALALLLVVLTTGLWGCKASQPAPSTQPTAPTPAAPPPASNQPPQSTAKPAPTENTKRLVAPDFELKNLAGTPVKLSSLRGQVVFINFWASWCPPCNDEMPELVKAHQEFGDRVRFIGINLLEQDKLSDVKAFLQKYGVKYETLLDEKTVAAKLYGVPGVPTSLVIDRQGYVSFAYAGPVTLNILRQEFTKALEVR